MLAYVSVLHWMVGVYYNDFLVNKGIGLNSVIQTFHSSTLSALYTVFQNYMKYYMWKTITEFYTQCFITLLIDWLIKLGGVCTSTMLCCFSRKTLVFWKRQPWVSLADVTLLVGVYKSLSNFWLKRVEDFYIRVSQIVVTKSGVLMTFI